MHARMHAHVHVHVQGLLLALEWVHRCRPPLDPAQLDSLAVRACAKLLAGLAHARRGAKLAAQRAAAPQVRASAAAVSGEELDRPAGADAGPGGSRFKGAHRHATTTTINATSTSSTCKSIRTSTIGSDNTNTSTRASNSASNSRTGGGGDGSDAPAHTQHGAQLGPGACGTQGLLRMGAAQAEQAANQFAALPESTEPAPGLCTAQSGSHAGWEEPAGPSVGAYRPGALERQAQAADPLAHALAQLLWVTVQLRRPLPARQMEKLLRASVLVRAVLRLCV